MAISPESVAQPRLLSVSAKLGGIFLLLAITATGNLYLSNTLHDSIANIANIINQSGRLRYLSQQIAFQSAGFVLEPGEAARQSEVEAENEFKVRYAGVAKEIGNLHSLMRSAGDDLEEHLGHIDKAWQDLHIALELWRSGDYGLLFTDLHMPKMDGYELTTAIRVAEKTGDAKTHIPIIAITANALKGEAEHCRAIGMDDYLSKPVQLADLKAMLDKWLPRSPHDNAGNAPGFYTGAAPPEGVGRALPAAEKTCRAKPDLQLQQQGGGNMSVDVNVLKALVGDDEATIRDFLHDFRIGAKKIAEELRVACTAGQTAVAGALAHKLKSSSRSVGALALGELCAAMEKAGKGGDTETLVVLLSGFEAEMAAVDEYLGLFLEKEEKS